MLMDLTWFIEKAKEQPEEKSEKKTVLENADKGAKAIKYILTWKNKFHIFKLL